MEISGTYQSADEKNRRKGFWSSAIVHLVLILIMILPLFQFPIPPPGQRGILVSFGEPDQGQGDDLPETQNIEPTKSSAQPVKESQKSVTPPKNNTPDLTTPREVMTTEIDPSIQVNAEKEKELERKRLEQLKQKELEEARRKAIEEEARKKAEEEARRKAEYEEKKAQFGSVFGEGKGSTETEGNEGDPAGKPDADILKGVSKGSGRVGEGLSDRGVVFEPTIQESSQKTGKVVIRVCVDSNGRVSESRFTQRGSTTTDSELVKVALENVRKYRFTDSEIEEQCGTITIDFKLRG